MTLIIGIVDKETGSVYMAGDSSSVAGGVTVKTGLKKVFKRNGFLIGYTTSFRMGQLLQYHLELNAPKRTMKPEKALEFMVTKFVPEIKKLFKDYGFAEVDNNKESGGTFLVAFDKHLFEVWDDYQVNYNSDNYLACGSGWIAALASLKTSKNFAKSPIQSMDWAMKSVSEFINTVCLPYKILNTKETKNGLQENEEK